jgi:hypothetical protein
MHVAVVAIETKRRSGATEDCGGGMMGAHLGTAKIDTRLVNNADSIVLPTVWLAFQ